MTEPGGRARDNLVAGQSLRLIADSSKAKDVRERAILMLLAIYGLRRGEVADLRLDQIDWAGRTLTFLAALREDRVEAPWLLDGPINAESFRIYVKQVLVPTLRQGDIVVMGNLGSHKSKAVRQAIRAAGTHLFFLPKYSPDLNPIEQFFAKLKHRLRKAAKRTIDEVSHAIAPILAAVSTKECANYFAHDGYGRC